MHTIGGVIKDLFKMLTSSQRDRGRLSESLIDYMLERNNVDLRETRPWEAGK